MNASTLSWDNPIDLRAWVPNAPVNMPAATGSHFLYSSKRRLISLLVDLLYLHFGSVEESPDSPAGDPVSRSRAGNLRAYHDVNVLKTLCAHRRYHNIPSY